MTINEARDKRFEQKMQIIQQKKNLDNSTRELLREGSSKLDPHILPHKMDSYGLELHPNKNWYLITPIGISIKLLNINEVSFFEDWNETGHSDLLHRVRIIFQDFLQSYVARYEQEIQELAAEEDEISRVAKEGDAH